MRNFQERKRKKEKRTAHELGDKVFIKWQITLQLLYIFIEVFARPIIKGSKKNCCKPSKVFDFWSMGELWYFSFEIYWPLAVIWYRHFLKAKKKYEQPKSLAFWLCPLCPQMRSITCCSVTHLFLLFSFGAIHILRRNIFVLFSDPTQYFSLENITIHWWK